MTAPRLWRITSQQSAADVHPLQRQPGTPLLLAEAKEQPERIANQASPLPLPASSGHDSVGANACAGTKAGLTFALVATMLFATSTY